LALCDAELALYRASAKPTAGFAGEERMPCFRIAALAAAVVLCTPLGSALAHGGRHCAKISDGTIVTSEGEPVTLGFDEWGYNYQAHLFIGGYCDAQRDAEWCQESADVGLKMSWNEAWLSSRDCDGDGLLDRHLGFETYRGSGARLTNTMTGTYELEGRRCRWLQRSVMVAAPLDAELVDGIWYDDDGDELGPVIWEAFIVIDRDLHDPCGGANADAVESELDGQALAG
jgi:hypothetical protein